MNGKLGEQIRRLRNAREYSQGFVAGKLDMSVGAYSNIERGKTAITIQRMCEIAKVLDTDIYYILGQADINRTELKDPLGEYIPVKKSVEDLEAKLKACITKTETLESENSEKVKSLEKEVALQKEIIKLMKSAQKG